MVVFRYRYIVIKMYLKLYMILLLGRTYGKDVQAFVTEAISSRQMGKWQKIFVHVSPMTSL